MTEFYTWFKRIPPGGSVTTRDGTVIENTGDRSAKLVIKSPKSKCEQTHDNSSPE